MNAIAGIKAELATRRKERDEAAEALNGTHSAYMKAQSAFHADQRRVDFLNDRIEALTKAFKDLGGTGE